MKGQPELCKSINQNLENTFLALSYERVRSHPHLEAKGASSLTSVLRWQSKDARLLGASVLGPSEVYERLKVFKNKLLLGPGKTLYVPVLYPPLLPCPADALAPQAKTVLCQGGRQGVLRHDQAGQAARDC